MILIKIHVINFKVLVEIKQKQLIMQLLIVAMIKRTDLFSVERPQMGVSADNHYTFSIFSVPVGTRKVSLSDTV